MWSLSNNLSFPPTTTSTVTSMISTGTQTDVPPYPKPINNTFVWFSKDIQKEFKEFFRDKPSRWRCGFNSSLWNELPEERKEHWIQIANDDQKRRQKELAFHKAFSD